MSELRFPENLDGYNDPWILFTTQRPNYNSANKSTGKTQVQDTDQKVSLYFPVGLTFSDSMNYENGQLGLGAELFDKAKGNSSMTFKDLAKEFGGNAARNTQDALTGNAASLAAQKVTNPREFAMFKSPNMREFSFSFTFLPQSQKEAESVPQIIKFFRKAAYPEKDGEVRYKFPEAFNITYKQASEGLIKIPQVVCQSVTVTYNPNSISFFKNGGMPVETTLELSFSEIRPISRATVDAGF